MTTRSAMKKLGSLVVAGGMTLAVAGTAFAAGSPTPGGSPGPAISVDNLKAKCEAAIDRRVGDLGKLQSTVSASKYLTPGQRTTLSGEIAAEQSGLAALRVKIAADTDRATLKADCTAIVARFRVYLLMIPKVHEEIAAGMIVDAGQRLSDVATKLQAAIDRAKAAGRDVADAQRDENNLKAAVAAGLGAAGPVPTLVNFTLPLNPSDFANDRDNLKTARQDIKTAHDDIVQARSDARQVVADLKALRPVATPTATVAP